MKSFLFKSDFGFPRVGWMGLFVVILFWGINWSMTGLRTQWAFAPLWIGYCLMMDGLVFRRKQTSLIYRNGWAFLGLFPISVVGWWMFEFFNWRLQNWTYVGQEFFSSFDFSLFASFSFSTVIPAVFETAELVGSTSWLRSRPLGGRIPATSKMAVGVFAMGGTMLTLMLLWPRYFFPFMWLSVFFIIEPINLWLGNRTLAGYVDDRDWRPLVALWLGALVCGFFWEMWNFYSYPKWVYHIPFVDFAHIFEMPILGYGGYLPFAMELFALYHFVTGLFGKKANWQYVELVADN